MINGGTGSFGNAILNRFLRTDIAEIRIFSRDEKIQNDISHDYQLLYPEVAHKIKFFIGDVRNLQSCRHTKLLRPGITKGQHWHNTKWEFFIVVSGHGLIQERSIDSDEVIEFEVTGEDIRCIQMLPGYTHNIINLSNTENLVTIMYSNEIFNSERPDTYIEPVFNKNTVICLI